MRSTRSSESQPRFPQRVSHNLFFALQPGEEARARINAEARRLRDAHPAAGRWINPQRYHLTLSFLGGHATLPEGLVAAAADVGNRVRVSSFSFALDIAGSFANRAIPWWIGCREMPPELGALWDAISAGLEGCGLRATQDRAPHVTILRDADRLLPTTPIGPIIWPVEEFVLVDSLLGPEPNHTVLSRWRLSR
ncbi:MAG TPA: 2'-5' RNA ligase family protein [Rhodanobacteraceae bacterium]|jgi:2'-5' RNA ligase|nr:2'-5' RNA ligase family protein [Rhodanobacteraceae bacterium]